MKTHFLFFDGARKPLITLYEIQYVNANNSLTPAPEDDIMK